MTTPLRCVVDISVCIKHFIFDLLTLKVNQLFNHFAYRQTEIFVPDLFYIECANTFWKYVRAGMCTNAEVQADLAILKALPLRVVSTANLMEEAVSIGLAHGISAYDASYVALSQQVSATLVTLDQRLVNALVNTAYDVCLFNNFKVPPLPSM